MRCKHSVVFISVVKVGKISELMHILLLARSLKKHKFGNSCFFNCVSGKKEKGSSFFIIHFFQLATFHCLYNLSQKHKKRCKSLNLQRLSFLSPSLSELSAEAARFELAVQFPVRQFSKLVVSATHPHLLMTFFS